MLFQYDHKWNPWSHVAALQIWNFSLSLIFCVVGYHFWMTLDVHTYPNITIITSWCPHRSFCVRFNLANFSFLALPAIPSPSVLSVSSLRENNPTITSRNSPTSAPKFTPDVKLSSAVKGASGGQTCSGKYSLANVVYIQTWNYLSVWFGKGAEQHYSNHLGWCQRTPVSLVFFLTMSKKWLWVG